MAQKNLDAMLITERLNYQYYTGHRSEQCAVDKIRSYMFILPKDGDPTLITMPFEIAQVEQTTFITDIRPTGGLTGHPEFIIDVLKSLGLEKARIGCELGREQYLGISYLGLQEVMKGLPQADFVDAADIILTVRNVKSPQEIEYLRRASIISAEAQKKTFAEVRAGMTENEVAQVLRQNLIANGAEKISLLCVLSGPCTNGIVLLPTDRVIQKGETLGFDVGVSYRGYWSDLARTASIGAPSEELSEFYSWMMKLRHDCNMQLTAGNKPADVIRVVDKYLDERGLKTMGVGRVGHGVGIETTEYPSLAAFEDITFEVGNVFACNPNFANHLGLINAEDNWAVTEGEPDLLSAPVAETEIPVVEA
jgi:Xaa-Pro aminopeptidase